MALGHTVCVHVWMWFDPFLNFELISSLWLYKKTAPLYCWSKIEIKSVQSVLWTLHWLALHDTSFTHAAFTVMKDDSASSNSNFPFTGNAVTSAPPLLYAKPFKSFMKWVHNILFNVSTPAPCHFRVDRWWKWDRRPNISVTFSSVKCIKN